MDRTRDRRLNAGEAAGNLYYGGADSCVALATGSIGHLLAWLDAHGTAG